VTWDITSITPNHRHDNSVSEPRQWAIISDRQQITWHYLDDDHILCHTNPIEGYITNDTKMNICLPPAESPDVREQNEEDTCTYDMLPWAPPF